MLSKNYKLSLQFLLVAIAIILSGCSAKPKIVQPPLKELVIADINSSNLATAEYVAHYQMGVNMALQEINNQGGVNNIKLKVEYYDDYGSYGESYRAGALAAKNPNVVALMGTFFAQTAKGVSTVALREQIPFLANGVNSESIISGENANEWTFRLKPSVNLQIESLVKVIEKEAQITSFTIVTYSNSEGEYFSDKIKREILAKRPNIKFANNVSVSQFNAYGEKLANDIYDTPSQGIIIAVDGYDIQKLTLLLERYKSTINKRVYILSAGEPEWLDSLGKFTPKYWIATGFPWYYINTKENIIFYKKYQKLYKRTPRYASYLGYSSVYLIAKALTDAGVTNKSLESRQRLAKALEQATILSPMGKIVMQKDHQSDLGVYVGVLKPYDKTSKRGNTTIKKLDVRMFDVAYIPFTSKNDR